MNNSSVLLSICIPTYNRAVILAESLENLHKQMHFFNDNSIEIIISDNCSTDDTTNVVNRYIKQNLPIVYNRNKENVGSNRNFLKCIHLARGKYIWLLGDDDYLTDGSLDYLVSLLRKDNYGLVHIRNTRRKKIKEYTKKTTFLEKVSFMSTFMSVNIFNSDNIENIANPEKYADTFFIQIPFYINAAINSGANKNLIICGKILDCGKASGTNGGYNYFEVICKNYLYIWKDFLKFRWINNQLFTFIKRDICWKWTIPHIYTYLLLKKLDANYNLDNSWRYIMAEYKMEPYFYGYMLLYPFYRIFQVFIHLLKRVICI